MTNPFDPQADYKAPKTESKYLKFEEGSTTFLPLDGAITGYEYWNLDGKPVRVKEMPEDVPVDIRRDKDGNPEPIKFFWAFPVFDMGERKIKLLEITQKTVMKSLRGYTTNQSWGSPIMRYTFTVDRDDSESITKYTVMANPPTEIDPGISEAWEAAKAKGFDINRLFSNGDPFVADESNSPTA